MCGPALQQAAAEVSAILSAVLPSSQPRSCRAPSRPCAYVLTAGCMRAGMLSGKLLQDFCPDTAPCTSQERGAGAGGTGTCDARALWGIIGAITATSPLLILVLQVQRPAHRVPFPGCKQQSLAAGQLALQTCAARTHLVSVWDGGKASCSLTHFLATSAGSPVHACHAAQVWCKVGAAQGCSAC